MYMDYSFIKDESIIKNNDNAYNNFTRFNLDKVYLDNIFEQIEKKSKWKLGCLVDKSKNRDRLVIFKSRSLNGGGDSAAEYYLIDDYGDYYMCTMSVCNKIQLGSIYAVKCSPAKNLLGQKFYNKVAITGFELIS